MDFTIESLLRPEIVVPTLTALVGLLGGWLLSRARSARDNGETGRGGDLAVELRDSRRHINLLQNENRDLSTFLMILPDLARQLNTSVEKRKIPQLLVLFIERLFSAEHIHIFLTARDGRSLTLAHGKGIPDELRGTLNVPFGHGRVGWVAANQITMDDSDFKVRVPDARSAASNIYPRMRTELCAPMISNDETLGVISIGGLLRRPKNEKNMLKMVADFGSIALQNTRLFSKVRESAEKDGLTDMANKSHFLSQLADEIIRSEKEQRPLSLFIFDIDHFKNYNDTNGHLAGDEALKLTGRIIKNNVRQEDFAARYGGEEFVVLLPNTDKEGALKAAEKIRRCVEESEYPFEATQPLGRITLSGGVASFPLDGKNTAELIRAADEALYAGKREGRNRVLAYVTRYMSGEEHPDEEPVSAGLPPGMEGHDAER